MAKNSITDYSNTAASNTDIQSVDIDEGCLPSGINNAIREIMADLADVNDGIVALTSPSFAAASLTGNLSFGDNNKAIFGAGSDLQIYHDGSNSYIDEAGSGGLYIRANSFLTLQKYTGENLAQLLSDGEVRLFYDGGQKLATKATGIDVTGTVTADGLTVDGDIGFSSFAKGITLPSGTTNADILRVGYTGGVGDTLTIAPAGGSSTSNLIFKTAAGSAIKQRMRILANGDISFYEDTGTTAKLFWDASAEALQIDTNGTGFAINSSSNAYMVIDRSAANRRGELVFSTASTNVINSPPLSTSTDWALGVSDSDELAGDAFYISTQSGASAAKMVITQAGSVGIGTSLPAEKLAVNGNIDFPSTSSTIGYDGSSGSTTRLAQIEFYNNSDGSMRLSTNNSSTGGINFYTQGAERLRVSRSGNLLVGTTSVNPGLGNTNEGHSLNASGTAVHSADGNNALRVNRNTSDGTVITIAKDGTTVGVIGTQNWGIGTSSPDATGLHVHTGSAGALTPNSAADDLVVESSGNAGITIASPDANYSGIIFSSPTDVTGSIIEYNQSGRTFDIGTATSGGVLRLRSGSFSEAMRIDSSGNLLVGKTSFDSSVAGVMFDTRVFATTNGAATTILNRLTSDGDIALFRKDGTNVGSIGSLGVNVYVANPVSGLIFGDNIVGPSDSDGTARDNLVDLGNASRRFDDIYATNGTIQTSDRNEKQDIEALSEAEQRVAVAAKGLLRKFRWIDSVDEKGDDARIHFGIIAQDLQAAFEAEGLDAGRYAMFINSTWTDEETGEERSRMGVRYNQLLAFIIAAI